MDPIIRRAPFSNEPRKIQRRHLEQVTSIDVGRLNLAQPSLANRSSITENHNSQLVHLEQTKTALLKEVEVERQKILKDAELKISAAMKDAERRGLEMGQLKAATLAKEKLDESVKKLNDIIALLHESRESYLANAEDAVVDLIFTIVGRIVGTPNSNKDAIACAVKNVMESERNSGQIVVRVNPNDLEELKSQTNSFWNDDDPRIQFNGDSTILTGGAIVVSETGLLDARLDTQLKQVRDALLLARNNKLSSKA
jgi:flagellar assembly protein FliH